MKVLNVIMSLDPEKGGGTVERTFQMTRFLARAGINCTLITTDLGLTRQRINALEGINLIALPTILKRFYFPKLSYRRIMNVVKDVDIIHLMNHWTVLNVLVYLIARRLNKPYVVCPAGALSVYGRSKTLKRLYNLFFGFRIIRDASGYIAISPEEIEQFEKYGVCSDKVSIIPNGINPDDFKYVGDSLFRTKFNLGHTPLILFMGRLDYIKGPDLVLKAFCELTKYMHFRHHLVFAGPDGGMLSELTEVVSNFGTGDRVHFIGYVGDEIKASAYYAADLLVIPSRQEAMSIVVLEAGITGTPALLTDRCGFSVVADIDGGRVVPATVDGLQEGLGDLLRSANQLKLMGSRLRQYVFDHFTWEAIINKYLTLYSKVLPNDAKNMQSDC